ncbi:MAG TPA: SGNH/GDSL hydrolase family protein [Solirubrobacterales bacterium]|nr:SGNH/GDSL hydrolase family protein [Solirubrobacterales bacterium]
MKPPRTVAVLGPFAALALLLAAAAGAAPHRHKQPIHPPAKVKIGRVALARTPGGRLALLAAVRYPIQAAGRRTGASVEIKTRPGTAPLAIPAFERLSAGSPRLGDRRRTFTFVHEFRLKPGVSRQLSRAWDEGRRPTVTVVAEAGIDIDDDGTVDIGRKGGRLRAFHLAPPTRPSAIASVSTAKPFCATVPVAEVEPHGHLTIPLPACTRPVRWSVTTGAGAGTVHLGKEELSYTAPRTPGTETIRLDHATVVVKVVQPWATLTPAGAAAGAGPVVRAMGDSVTAGFGFYGDGTPMGLLELYECKPFGEVLDDACSSNSTATRNGLKEVPYAPDYGLANNISWAAQWATDYGVTNYKNYAVSGSEPTNWAPGGNLYATTRKIEAEDPDYILMTVGANPILADTLFGLGPALCALESDIVGGYSECVEEAFEGVHLRAELKRLYTNLVEKTHATIYLMQYHLSIPSSALAYSVTEIAEMAKLMNETIAEVAAEVSPTRLKVVTPPHFNVGVSLEPVYPSSYTCSYFEYGVDGPSVQSTPTQVELELDHYLSFCGGPQGGGEPWVISADTGIHPSPAGYQQMASQVPPPAPGPGG